jgi:hypothetical protein
VLRQRGVVYDVGRAMGALSVNWRPDYSPALMRRELDIIQADLHANAVRLGGRDPRRVLAAARYAASLGLDVWLGPELWNATPKRTLRYIAEASLPFERVDWDHFDVVGVNFYRQHGFTTDQRAQGPSTAFISGLPGTD